jgi:uncharacterized membrane protein
MNDPGRFVLVAALLFGATFAIVTPPFQVPDETAHFYRAYRVSEGRLDLLPAPGHLVAPLPVSLHRLGGEIFGDLPFHPERRTSPRAILTAFRIPLAPERREPVVFANVYTCVSYIAPAIGIAAGRLLGAPALALLYLARLTNLLCGAVAIAFAVRRLPAFAWLTAMVALTPMALSLLGSASGDVTILASSFLLVATVARLAWGTAEARRSDLVLLAVASAVLCASKPPYLPLALLVLLIPAVRFPRGRRAGFLLLCCGFSLLAAAWPVVTSRPSGFGRSEGGVDAGRQIHDSLLHPFHFLGVVIRDYAVHSPRYLGQLVGKLGWLDVQVPIPFLVVYLAVLLALVFLDTSPRIEVRPWQRGTATVAVLAGMVLVSASQYATWTPYGADFILGIQGRYFLPLVLPAAWILHSRRWAGRIAPGRLGMALAAFSLLSCGIALWALVGRYYGI